MNVILEPQAKDLSWACQRMEIRTTRGLYQTAKGFWGDADPASRSNHLSVQIQRTTTRQRPFSLKCGACL